MAESGDGELMAASMDAARRMGEQPVGTLRRTFTATGHSGNLLQGLAHLRLKGQLLDVTLEVEDQSFKVHRAVLAACSHYFRAMFTGGMREASLNVIRLQGLSAKGLGHILDFAYCGEVTLHLDCVEDVLGAAVFLQMAPVISLCEEFLKAAMSVDTCLNIGQMAMAFGLVSLKESVDSFTCAHFLEISAEEDFLHLPLERLVFFLQSDRLQSCTEVELFFAAVRWLRHAPERRARAAQVLGHVRFPLMTSDELVDRVQPVDLMTEDPACCSFLLEAFNYQVLPFRQHEMQSRRTSVRSEHTSLLAFGGTPYMDVDQSVSSKFYQLPHSLALQFHEVGHLEQRCSHPCIAILDNFVFVAGGQHVQFRSGEGAVNTCFRYNPHLDKWLRLAPMQECRIQFHLAVQAGNLYAVGGRNHLGSLSSVERYSPRLNRWAYVASLPRRTWGHAGAALEGRIYVAGGYGVTDEDKRALQCYEPEADTWEVRAAMNESRVLHAMVSARGRVYALGGRMEYGVRCFNVPVVEYYDPRSDQWTLVSPMRTGQSEAGYALVDQRIFIVGGYNWHLNNVTSIVQVYNVDTDEWERDLPFPEALAGIACAAVNMPNKLPERQTP
uniref:kelch-like protein 26 n=1 Tax=Myxine glutinosa TaxID=7769 RepID=UPI00358DFF98